MLNEIRELNLQDFVARGYGTEEQYWLLKNSKPGFISIKKISDNPGYFANGDTFTGYTEAFGEGLQLRITNHDSWYKTSRIKSIQDNTFNTQNSVYEYTFNKE